MKIKISYLPEETELAQLITRLLRFVLKKPRVKEREEHPPHRQIYMSIDPPGQSKKRKQA